MTLASARAREREREREREGGGESEETSFIVRATDPYTRKEGVGGKRVHISVDVQ